MTDSIDKVLSLDEAGKFLGVTANAVGLAIKEKKLPAQFYRGRWHVRASALRTYQLSSLQDIPALTVEEACKLKGIDKLILLKAIQRGDLPVRKPSKSETTRILRSELDLWVKKV